MSLISVIMPTYNGAKYIESSVLSILNQSYQNIELIVIVDGSSDNTEEILKSIKDKRLRYFINEKNSGIAFSTNRGFEEAQGEFVAMADHDDMSLPDRIQTQYEFLKANPKVDGCYGKTFDIYGDTTDFLVKDIAEPKVASKVEENFVKQFFGFAVVNPTAMFRKEILLKMDKWFDINLKVSTDLDFYERAFENGFVNWVGLDNVLIQYRKHVSNTSLANKELSRNEALNVVARGVKRVFPEATDEELSMHKRYLSRYSVFSRKERAALINWFNKIIQLNKEKQIFDNDIWLKTLEHYWRSAISLAFIYNPFAAYRTYASLNGIDKYKKPFKKFLYEWQKVATNILFKKLRFKG